MTISMPITMATPATMAMAMPVKKKFFVMFRIGFQSRFRNSLKNLESSLYILLTMRHSHGTDDKCSFPWFNYKKKYQHDSYDV